VLAEVKKSNALHYSNRKICRPKNRI